MRYRLSNVQHAHFSLSHQFLETKHVHKFVIFKNLPSYHNSKETSQTPPFKGKGLPGINT